MKILRSLALLLFLSLPALAATYNVKTTGSNSNTCTQAQSASTPKLTVAAGLACAGTGDTVVVFVGTYSESVTIPAGGVGAYNTLTVNGTDVVTITAVTMNSHTKLIGNCATPAGVGSAVGTCGFTFNHTGTCLSFAASATDWFVRANTFQSCSGFRPANTSGATITNFNTFYYFQNNTMAYAGCVPPNPVSTCAHWIDDWGTNSLVEGNDFSHYQEGTNIQQQFHIWRNNTFHDQLETEAGSNGHSDPVFAEPNASTGNVVIEGNSLRNAVGTNAKGFSLTQNDACSGNGTCTFGNWIERFNVVSSIGAASITNDKSWPNIKVYNSTFVDEGFSASQQFGGDNMLSSGGGLSVLNSIWYQGPTGASSGVSSWNPYACTGCVTYGHSLYYCNPACSSVGGHTYGQYSTNPFTADPGNIGATNPSFVNYVSAGSTSNDYHLKSGSPAIAAGTNLTTANGACSGCTAITLTDVTFFQDGYGLTNSYSTVAPDCIAITTVSNVVCLVAGSINYSTNSATLASAKTWSNGDPIWLANKSDGVQVLTGAAPDMGAFPFSSAPYTITISSIVGHGTVTSSDSILSCTTGTTGTCTDSSATGSTTLTASPSAGWAFTGWGGSCSGSSTTFTVTSAAACTASFIPVLTVSVSSAGGSVSDSVGAIISCTSTSGTCSGGVGGSDTLTETTSSGFAFTGWSGGGCSGTASTCTVSVSSPTTVTASFSPVLTVTVTGSGGSVSDSVGAIVSCTASGGTCSGNVSGTDILTATPTSGHVFSGWSGGGCSGSSTTCTVNITAGTTVTATFSVSLGSTPGLSGAFRLSGNFNFTPTPACGFPLYACSAVNISSVVCAGGTSGCANVNPAFSGLTGAPGYNATPEPGNPSNIDNVPLYRLTDYTFASAHIPNAGKTMSQNCSGNGFNIMFDTLDQWLISCDSGAAKHLWQVNPSTSPATFTWIQTLPNVGSQPDFSTVTPAKYYFMDNTTSTQVDYALATSPGTTTSVFDFSVVCPSWDFTRGVNATDPPMENYGDVQFATGFSGSGSQDTGRIVAVYNVSTGNCYWINGSTTQVFGPSGLIGNYNPLHGTWKIHQVAQSWGANVNIAIVGANDTFTLSAISTTGGTSTATYAALSDGTQAITGESFTISGTVACNGTFTISNATATTFKFPTPVGCTTETSGSAQVNNDNGGDPFAYTPGASDLSYNCNGTECSGHYVGSHDGFIDAFNQTNFVYKLQTAGGVPDFTFPVGTTPCSGHQSPWDSHPNIVPRASDSGLYVMFGSTSGNTAPDYTAPCTMEVIGYKLTNASPGTVKRFAHCNSYLTWSFNSNECIVAFSQSGNFFSFSSNMNNSVGSTTGGSSCTPGTVGNGPINGTGGNCRSDLFVGDLRQQ